MGDRVGIREVAAMAGVSLGSVSHYLNHPERVSAASAERIQIAIDALGFVRNGAAGQLRHGRSNLIAHIAPNVSTPSFNAMNDGAITAATELDLSMFIASTQGSRTLEDSFLSVVEQMRVDGIIVASRDSIEDRLQPIRKRGTPVVLMGQHARLREQPSVSADDVRGGYLVGEHFAKQGRMKVAFVGGPLSFHSVANRYQGLVKSLQGTRARIEIVNTVERTTGEGIQIAQEILRRHPENRPDAIFCVNDLLALGVLQVLNETPQLRVPQDIALVGYDDTPFAKVSLIPLSSVRAADQRLGETAVKLLHEAIERLHPDPSRRRAAPEARHVVYQPELMVRASSSTRVSSP